MSSITLAEMGIPGPRENIEGLRTAVLRELMVRDKESVLDELETLRVKVRLIGRSELEDSVLDVMDMVVGWCAPSESLDVSKPVIRHQLLRSLVCRHRLRLRLHDGR